MSEPASPMIKGAAIRAFIDWYGERYGQERLHLMAERACALAEDAGVLEPAPAGADPHARVLELLPATWYPAPLVHSILEALAQGESEGSMGRLIREANRAVIARGVGSVYRFFLQKLVSPEIYALSVPRFWRQLHTTGERRMTITGPREAESVVKNWPGHHPILCTITIETMCAIFETMGLQDVKWRRVECVSRGGTECRTELRWRRRGDTLLP